MSPANEVYSKWGLNKKTVVSKYLNNNYTEFTPAIRPNYNNKIMNFIVAIDNSLKSKIFVLRSKSKPTKDFLFVNNRLYSIMENHGRISNDNLNIIINRLTITYDKPNIQKDKFMIVYSYFDKHTKVLVYAFKKNNNIKCRVYHYAKNLFKMLINE